MELDKDVFSSRAALTLAVSLNPGNGFKAGKYHEITAPLLENKY